MSRHIKECERTSPAPVLRTKVLFAICALASLATLAPRADAQAPAPSAVRPVQAKNPWELEIVPLAERFERASDVRLLLTVRNVGPEPRTVALPYLPGAAWPQWIAVTRDDVALDPAAEIDFAAEPATLAPGQQMSVLVGLDRFLSAEAFRSAQPGSYAVRWDGGTIGFASSASASFALTGAPLAGAAPASLESFLAPARAGETLEERVHSAWLRFAATPSDPRAIAFAGAVPPQSVDVLAAFQMLETTRDLGVQRAIVQLLGRIGRDELVAERMVEFLARHRDPSLASLGAEALGVLRGE